MKHEISENLIEIFRMKLLEDEKSKATIDKYMKDVRMFFRTAERNGGVDKELVMAYKEFISGRYAPTSANSMLAALNCFFKKMGWYDCTVKLIKIQKDSFRAQEREMSKAEYYRLLRAAKAAKNERLYLVMETMCSTGIRVSELQFITMEALGKGQAKVSLKGKTRTVLLPAALTKKLKKYVRKKKIRSGSIFVTRSGKPVDRSNICHEMKALCEAARVAASKVFPHNLRHLFACTYYRVQKDLSHLADILGHSNVNTTRIYTLVSGKTQMKRIESLGLVT